MWKQLAILLLLFISIQKYSLGLKCYMRLPPTDLTNMSAVRAAASAPPTLEDCATASRYEFVCINYHVEVNGMKMTMKMCLVKGTKCNEELIIPEQKQFGAKLIKCEECSSEGCNKLDEIPAITTESTETNAASKSSVISVMMSILVILIFMYKSK